MPEPITATYQYDGKTKNYYRYVLLDGPKQLLLESVYVRHSHVAGEPPATLTLYVDFAAEEDPE